MRLFACLLFLPLLADADERILSFHSDIVIESDATILVTETIRVRSEQQQIRRGIYRYLPVEYYDKRGNRHVVSIVPQSVTRDGMPEPWHVRQPRGSVTTYFGEEDVFLSPGVYEYRFVYRAYRMLGFFEEHDELYWNVTGFNWAFPIDRASATVSFGFDVPFDAIIVDAYTGSYGQSGRDYTVRRDSGPTVEFAANSPLGPANGLTIVVGWPKGLVEEPSQLQELMWLLRDNRNTLVALAGFVLLLAYFIPVWLRYGRDPALDVVVTRYTPPRGYSPASLRYVDRMYYDNKVLTAALVNLAVKGYLTIEQEGKKRTLVHRRPDADAPPLAPGEQELYDALFRISTRVELKQENHEIVGEARKLHRKSLIEDYKGRYFKTNTLMSLPGIAIVVVSTIIAFNVGLEPTPLMLFLIVLSYATLGGFAVFMRKPTARGQKLLEQIAGFKDYLEVAEKDELNLRNPPEKTPELFEQYLPYALAMDVDQKWSEKFASVLAAVRDDEGNNWHPSWYRGNLNSLHLSSDLSGTFAGAVSSSVTPPGSSSGSGGGGFSGGGGGGGGGGGW